MSSSPVHRVYNFNAGPAGLPLEVLETVQRDLLNYQNTGMGVMEMSHRSKAFENIIKQAEKDLRDIIGIPSNYKVIFMQGGGSSQFSCVPLNLCSSAADTCAYIITGTWSETAFKEAKKYSHARVLASSADDKFSHIPAESTWTLTEDEAKSLKYVYYCHNETVNGTEFSQAPVHPLLEKYKVPLVCDMSSCFMSGPIDVSKYGLIFAGAQKNVGPSGVTVVIVREDLLGKHQKMTPTMFNYGLQAEKESLYNTPPTFAIYITGLVFQWIQKQGGLPGILKINQQKADLVYQTIDESNGFYKGIVAKANRSRMNVVFTLSTDVLEKAFIKAAEAHNFIGVAGHRSVGGCRISLYNAVTIEATEKLAAFMKEFMAQQSQSQSQQQ